MTTETRTSEAGTGLTSHEAARRLVRDGGNVLPTRRPPSLWRRVVSQLRDPLVLVLLAAAAFTLATADFTDASVILFVIVVNTTVGVIQEVKAERAISALSALTAPDARVVRDGGQREVPAADLVVGDLLVLAEGDIVPADATVVQAVALLVDEAALTGESARSTSPRQEQARRCPREPWSSAGAGRPRSPRPAQRAPWAASRR
ncbi:cation-transporting P-type ATPase [Winogradskya humida]|uniref:P-type ATPase n=1 Tax=Winogradskya humida TaxID=113566 RepID=UPI0023B358C5|nr:cation-transporting P-type ATPase [Actinoplanes humidus]